MDIRCDAHCHLDFYEHASEIIRSLLDQGHSLLNACVTPDTSLDMLAHSSSQSTLNGVSPHKTSGTLLVGLGMHPWYVSGDPTSQKLQQLFITSLPQFLALGEVGLDFSARYRPYADSQVAFFKKLLATLDQPEQPSPYITKVLSLHAVKSTDIILELLSSYKTYLKHRIIFHWFSGSHDDLLTACNLGCLFSVNLNMLNTKKGQAYIRALPLKSLLVETDAPNCANDRTLAHSAVCKHIQLIDETYRLLADLKGVSVSELAEHINHTMKTLGCAD